MKTIAIIGFGFSGTVFFLNLINSIDANQFNILIFEKKNLNSSNLNLGPAFSAFSKHYILNVAAKNMSICSNNQNGDYDSFVDFLIKKHPKIYNNITENGFAPREIYGQYLLHIRNQAFKKADSKQISYKIISREVEVIKSYNSQLLIKFLDKNFIIDKLVLATSLKQAKLPFYLKSKNFISSLWSNNYFNFHNSDLPKTLQDPSAVITLIGSGLSGVDVIAGLIKKNFLGKIIVISRRGNFPKKHFIQAQKVIEPLLTTEDAKAGFLKSALKIRNFLKANPAYDLRNVIDSIRPIIKDLWINFDQKNKKIFLKFIPYWNIFRHRAPDFSIELIESLIKNERILIKKGRVENIKEINDKIFFKIKNEEFQTNYLVNCLGFDLNPRNYFLLNNLIQENLLKEDLVMIKPSNDNIYLLGGLNIGQYFESTAVPELRKQAEELAQNIC
jgi:uncharacterized NAD(P)/FAD-binding protein YdhS